MPSLVHVLFYLYCMKLLILLLFTIFCSTTSLAQHVPSYKAEDLVERISNDDTLYVVNFWATWCGPCVREMPEFTLLHDQYAEKPVKILLVSLDFKDAYPKKVQSFIKKRKLQPEVVWLNETNANEFIPKLESSWQGSIPATLLLYGKKQYRNFFEGMITAKQLSMLIDKQLAY